MVRLIHQKQGFSPQSQAQIEREIYRQTKLLHQVYEICLAQSRHDASALEQGLGEELEIKEVDIPSADEELGEDGGVVETWNPIDPPEKKVMRALITGMVILLWAFWIMVGLIRYMLDGDGFLLITASPMILFITKIVGYYFASD